MSNYLSEIRAQFAREIAGHQMTLMKADGIYRHLSFGRPGTGIDRFDLTTWPGHLAFTGDRGDYVFCRTEDMFQFFRKPLDREIDYRYWAEKCVAADKSDGITRYSAEEFREVVRERWAERFDGKDSSRYAEDLADVLRAAEEGEEAAHAAADACTVGGKQVFPDFWESTIHRYTHRFVWAREAIRWGVAKFDGRAG